VLHEWDAGAKMVDLVRRHGVTEQTLYRWKKKYVGMQATEAKRLKALEEENRQLKRLVADQSPQTTTVTRRRSVNPTHAVSQTH
jgi:putative transposase